MQEYRIQKRDTLCERLSIAQKGVYNLHNDTAGVLYVIVIFSLVRHQFDTFSKNIFAPWNITPENIHIWDKSEVQIELLDVIQITL